MANVVLDWDDRYKKGIIISDFLNHIRSHFSVPNENKSILQKRFVRFIPERIHIITSTGRFDIGLLDEIICYLANADIKYNIDVTDKLRNIVNSKYAWCDAYETATLNIQPYPYQKESTELSIKHGKGIIVVGTGGGKTLIAANIIETIRKYEPNKFTTLLLLPANLVKQTYNEFVSYGIKEQDMSMWIGNEIQHTPIILASVSTVHAAIGAPHKIPPLSTNAWFIKNNTRDLQLYKQYYNEHIAKESARLKNWKKDKTEILTKKLNNVKLLLIDEVHTCRKGNQINDLIDIFDTPHKFGFTGTLPANQIDVWNVIGKIGPVLIDISSRELRDQKRISDVNTYIIRIKYKKPPRPQISFENPVQAYKEECDFLYESPFRNNIIQKLASSVDNNCLIMVDKINHGLILESLLNKINKRIYFVRGEVDNEEREKIKQIMENNSDVVCIAMSRIFAVGVNIKNLHYIIFAQGGKAKITLVQSIGRGLRLHETKNCLTIFDIADETYYGKQHLDERMLIYEKEQIPYELRNFTEK